MKKIHSIIAALLMITLSGHGQTLIKLKQLEQTASPSSVIVTVGTPGVPTYTTKLPASVIPTLSAYVPYTGATASVNLGANNFSVGAVSTLSQVVTNTISSNGNASIYLNTNGTRRIQLDNTGITTVWGDSTTFAVPFRVEGGGSVNGTNPYAQLKGYYIGAYRILNSTTGVEWWAQNNTIAGSELDIYSIGVTANPSQGYVKVFKRGKVIFSTWKNGVYAQRASIDTTGIASFSYAVGIGTATPTSSLDLRGDLRVSTTSTLTGKVYFGAYGTAATAYAHFGAGTTGAGTAPIKLTSGSLMSSAEVGAIEFLTDKPYFTITTGTARKEIQLRDNVGLVGRIPFQTTDGRLTDDASLFYSTNTSTGLQVANRAMIGTNSAATATLHVTGDFLVTTTSTLTGGVNTPTVANNGQLDLKASSGNAVVIKINNVAYDYFYANETYLGGKVMVNSVLTPVANMHVMGTMSVQSTATLASNNIFGTTASSNTHTFYCGSTGAKAIFRPVTGSTTYGALHLGDATLSATNYILASNDMSTSYVNAATTLNLSINAVDTWRLDSYAKCSVPGYFGSSVSTSPHASAQLMVASTTKGFLPPVMTATQGSAISSPAEGLMIYVTDTNGTFTAKGWWGYDGAAWQKLNN